MGHKSEGRLGNRDSSSTRASPSPGEQSAKARSSSSRVPEDELQKCQVGKSRVATLFDRGVPIPHTQPSALESEAEAATVEGRLHALP